MRWMKLEQLGDVPGPRSSHTIAHIGSLVYLFGGELEPRVPVANDTYQYDMTTHEWCRLDTTGEAPDARVGATMAAAGTDVYLYGGRTGKDMAEGTQTGLWVLDTTTSQWAPVTPAPSSGPAPPPRSYHAMAAMGGKLYVFGGCGEGGRLSDLHAFDTSAKVWTRLPDAPSTVAPRGGAALVAAADGRHIILIGGFCGHELGDAHVFDIVGNCWKCWGEGGAEELAAAMAGHTSGAMFPSLPRCSGGCSGNEGEPANGEGRLPPRSVFGAAAHVCSGCTHAGHVVAFGGEVDPSSQGHAGAGCFSGDTWCYDMGKGSWHALTPDGQAPCPRGWFASVALEGCLLLHGGLDGANKRLGDMHLLQLHPDGAKDSMEPVVRRRSIERGIFN